MPTQAMRSQFLQEDAVGTSVTGCQTRCNFSKCILLQGGDELSISRTWTRTRARLLEAADVKQYPFTFPLSNSIRIFGLSQLSLFYILVLCFVLNLQWSKNPSRIIIDFISEVYYGIHKTVLDFWAYDLCLMRNLYWTNSWRSESVFAKQICPSCFRIHVVLFCS